MHCHWRDCQEWRSEGLTLSTCSNEAAKLFDIATSQYVGMYEDEEFGGMHGTLKSLVNADPNFVMGHVVQNTMAMIGLSKTPRVDAELSQNLEHLAELTAKSPDLTDREHLHVKAVQQFADGYMDHACDTWEQILYNHPTDAFVARLLQNSYYFLGYNEAMRDSVARILPEWPKSRPLYGYLLGIYSFGLCETRDFEKATVMAHKALELNRRDSWSSHTVAHVCEMKGEHDKGLRFLDSTVDDWQPQSMVGCHINWHAAVYHVEKGNYDAALEIFDNAIMNAVKKSEGVFNISDGTSLLFRLSMEGCDVSNRWKDLCDVSVRHIDDHLLTFYDAHLLMAYLGANSRKHVDEFLHSLNHYISVCTGSNIRVAERVGLPLFQAIIDYDSDKFDAVVDRLLPLKYEITDGLLSGSRAQRDVFMQLLIHAAMKSPTPRHQVLARRLLNERRALRPISPLTDRLISKLKSADTANHA